MAVDTDRLECFLRTPAEAMRVAVRASGVCADPVRVASGLAELLLNAVEHGNLRIGHELKFNLLQFPEAFDAEVMRRLAQPQFARRRVRLVRIRAAQGWCFEIEDEGDGFDWRMWLAGDAAARRSRPCGRGIVLAAQLCAAPLEYVGNGNRVRVYVPEQA